MGVVMSPFQGQGVAVNRAVPDFDLSLGAAQFAGQRVARPFCSSKVPCCGPMGVCMVVFQVPSALIEFSLLMRV